MPLFPFYFLLNIYYYLTYFRFPCTLVVCPLLLEWELQLSNCVMTGCSFSLSKSVFSSIEPRQDLTGVL